jgi:hypothetical protein
MAAADRRRRDPEEWAASARIANSERWAKATAEERARMGQRMRAGKRALWASEIDPEGLLSPADLQRRLDHMQKAEMRKLTRSRLMRRKHKK